jgi:hypothetical protein
MNSMPQEIFDVWSDEWHEWRTNHRSRDTMREIALAVEPIVDEIDALVAYASRKQLTINEVVYYLNAWEYGGDAGLEALRNPEILTTERARRAAKQVEKALTDAGFTRMRVTDEGTAIGVYEIMTRSNGDYFLMPCCQLRWTSAGNLWHLYWMRKFHAWWPYPPSATGHRFSLAARIRQLITDPDGCFWG